jgi:hypothetical protein
MQPIQAEPAALYQDMVGQAANSTQSSPATSTVMANGQSRGLLYNVQRQPNRLDFFANREPDQATKFPTITNIPDAISKFQSRLNAASKQLSAVNRVALVVNISKVVDSMNAANQQVSELTGIEFPFDDLSDVLFQLNRRMELPVVSGMQLNRVLKWLVETFQIVEVVAGSVNVHNIYAVTLSVDVNTVPVPNRLYQTTEQATIFGAMAAEVERLCGVRTLRALGE